VFWYFRLLPRKIFNVIIICLGTSSTTILFKSANLESRYVQLPGLQLWTTETWGRGKARYISPPLFLGEKIKIERRTNHTKYTFYLLYCSRILPFGFFYLVREAIGTAATAGLLCQPRVIVKMIVEKQMEWRLAGETEVLGRNLPQRHFCPLQNPT
jgi:hypothetical protein